MTAHIYTKSKINKEINIWKHKAILIYQQEKQKPLQA